MNSSLYILKIRLVGIEPEITRRFTVPANITLDRLHDVIQIVMGWQDCHLHHFTIGGKNYMEYPESKEDGLVSGKYRLGNLVKQKGRSFKYIYDFGDCWEHEITLEEKVTGATAEEMYMVCLEGERACPPEDSGGTDGYKELLEVLSNPESEDYEEAIEWLGEGFDSESFSNEYVTWELSKYAHWSRDRLMKWHDENK